MTDSLREYGVAVELPTIGVMVLNQNGERWLPPLFESLRRQGYPRLKVFLVDNASTDRSVGLTIDHYPEVAVLRLSRNAGYCMAYNLTMPIAFSEGCEWVIWANNDVLLESGCLLEMGRIASKHRDTGIIGPAFISWDSDDPNYYMLGKHPSAIEAMRNGEENPLDVDWVEGSFLMVSRICVEKIGWLDPYLFFYWEETDFCRRARREKWRVVLAPKALARHYAGGWSSGNTGNSNTANLLKSRNQYIYVLANPNRVFAGNLIACLHLFLVLLRASIKISRNACIYEIRVLMRVLAEIGPIWNKWRRDRRGVSPEPIASEYEDIKVEAAGKANTKVREY